MEEMNNSFHLLIILQNFIHELEFANVIATDHMKQVLILRVKFYLLKVTLIATFCPNRKQQNREQKSLWNFKPGYDIMNTNMFIMCNMFGPTTLL